METISEKTLVPISLIVAIGGSFLGGVAWLTALWFQSDANAYAIVEIKKDQKEIRLEIREDLHRLEKKVDKLLERQR